MYIFRIIETVKLKKRILFVLKIYVFTWLFSFALFVYFGWPNNASFDKLIDSYLDFSFSKSGLISINILFLIFLLFAIILTYFISVYKNKGFKTALKRFVFRLVLPISLVVFTLKFIIYHNTNEDFIYEWNYDVENKSENSNRHFLNDSKIRGMNVYQVGRRRNIATAEIIKSNIEWISVIPYFYQETENSIEMNIPENVGIWSKRDSAFINDIEKLHKKGLFVMIKPHLWMSSGWRSNINFDTKKDWDSWFDNYRKNMIHFAKMAQKSNAQMFCVGTELRSSLENQPDKWLLLIDEIKSFYKGKLTYAANWDDTYDFTAFWKEMDYIGIQAYYPLTTNSNPNLEEIKQGWNKHIKHLKELHTKYNKQILFTEIGYRNDLSATKTPWEWGNIFQRLFTKKSDKTQQLAYEAMFQKLWKEDWFAGLFPWEWSSSDFPVYKKPAQNTISIWYNN